MAYEDQVFIDDLRFDAGDVRIEAYRSIDGEHVHWGIVVACTKGPLDWEPVLTAESLFVTRPEELLGVRDLGARAAGLTAGRHAPTLYVFDSHELRNCSTVLAFGAQDELEFTCTGQCDVFWDERYGKDLALWMRVRVRRVVLLAAGSGEAQARSSYGRFLNVDRFSYDSAEGGLVLRLVS
jgi:hypothetical protein